MVSDEQKMLNRAAHFARHAKRNYTRASQDEVLQMKCHVCGQRPHIKLTDYREDNARRCVMLACDCREKFRWFEMID